MMKRCPRRSRQAALVEAASRGLGGLWEEAVWESLWSEVC